MADPISAVAAYVTAQIVAATATTSLVTAQIIYGAVYVGTTVAVSAGLTYASSAIGGSGPSPDQSGQAVAAAMGSAEPNRHLVGRCRTFGVMAWQGSFAGGDGDTVNKVFGQMQVISSSPITEIEAVFCADVELVGIPALFYLGGFSIPIPDTLAANQSPFNDGQGDDGVSRLYYRTDVGSDPGVRDALLGFYADQPWQPLVPPPYADPDGSLPLGPFYPLDARGDGLAKLSSAAFQDVNSFPAGPPRMSVVGKGVPVFDPRDPDQYFDDPETWQWSENPALIAAWYITRPFGFDDPFEDIDLDLLISAANCCDVMVDTFSSTGAGGDDPVEKRYRISGEIIESQNRDDTLNQICACMAGSWAKSGGKWFLYAGQYYAPTESVDNDWIMRNVVFTAQKSRFELYNTVRGNYLAEARRWQTSPYPQVQDAAALADDNGEEIVETIDLAFVPSHTQAQRCMLIELRRSHLPRIFKFETPVGFALRLMVGQTIALTQTGLGYEIGAVPFRVNSWELTPQDESGELWVSIELTEESSAIYNIDLSDLLDADDLSPGDPPPEAPASTGEGNPPPEGEIEPVVA